MENDCLKVMNNFEEKHCISIGDVAPDFTANTTMGPIRLSDYKGSWVVLFSHPGDFTPVCTTEFICFAKLNNEFLKRNCNLIGLSIDSNPSHLAWVNNIHRTTGITIPFPIIADLNMDIAKKYSMIAPNVSNTSTIRSVYIIDPNQRIRCILSYPKTCGRNIGEILRILESLQITDNQNVLTPANWVPNQATIIPAPQTYKELIERTNDNSMYTCLDWYLCFNENTNNSNNLNM